MTLRLCAPVIAVSPHKAPEKSKNKLFGCDGTAANVIFNHAQSRLHLPRLHLSILYNCVLKDRPGKQVANVSRRRHGAPICLKPAKRFHVAFMGNKWWKARCDSKASAQPTADLRLLNPSLLPPLHPVPSKLAFFSQLLFFKKKSFSSFQLFSFFFFFFSAFADVLLESRQSPNQTVKDVLATACLLIGNAPSLR